MCQGFCTIYSASFLHVFQCCMPMDDYTYVLSTQRTEVYSVTVSVLHLKLTNESTDIRSNQGDSKHLEAQYARYTEVHILSCCTIVPSPVSSMHSRPRECRPRNDEGPHILSDVFQSSSGGYSFRETCIRSTC